MIQIEDKLVSMDVMEQLFTCDISKCKGACCVEGELGAPLEKKELPILKKIYPEVKPYMRPEGIAAVEEQGTHVVDFTGDDSTPLVNDRECAYVAFDDKGVALCTIEQAWRDGKISFRKPVSCHLYPIRVTKFPTFEAVNYDRWDICSAACSHGATTGLSVYQFAKEAIIRKFGEKFYDTLDEIAKDMASKTDS
ncbi:DUF3109 family protein [Pontibacter sp. G13]|uniref:DUF3109 family protein n=1 Tax=Pontibacter sp. G13 TaxID=3074898 RepID=UPI00288C0CCB|nr:DUF3109 family protein [Pontibacter sp. G13]WNJ21146.1 DUF3109 family protein [Pontibacter sp. G13]